MSLAGTVLLVGGVGVLSVMLISFSDRRYEIGLRKSLGASDGEIFIQFLLEAAVLASLGALAGTVGGALLCRALSDKFPYGLVVNPALIAARTIHPAIRDGAGPPPGLDVRLQYAFDRRQAGPARLAGVWPRLSCSWNNA